jgi:hypothetical protein
MQVGNREHIIRVAIVSVAIIAGVLFLTINGVLRPNSCMPFHTQDDPACK